MRAKFLVKRLLSPFTSRIRSGPLQGKRWVLASGSRFVRGTYEPETCRAFERFVRPGHVVFDIGGHVGYFTVLSSQLTGSTGRVFTFEPLPTNLQYLRRHIQLNDCTNVSVMELCIGDQSGTAYFDDSHGTGVGHLSSSGKLQVRVRSLDEMIAADELPIPDVVKIDVEGAEMLVLEGAKSVLGAHHPVLILSTHSAELDRLCRERLARHGYACETIEPGTLLATVPSHLPRAVA
jgi:FkbM family methyltransferase